MKHVEALLKEMEERSHPGQYIVRVALDQSTSPECLHYVGGALMEAAYQDWLDERKLLASLVKVKTLKGDHND